MADVKEIGGLTVNDGRGLLDNEGLCDSLIENLNNLLKNMAAGQYIRVCSITMEMVQKLTNLKKNIHTEQQSMERNIQELQERYNELAEQAFNTPKPAEEEHD
jgi:flagellar capping protein FliD